MLLAELGFTNVVFFADLLNKVQSADQDSLPGHVLSNGIDANGRMIGVVYAGNPSLPDGSDVFLDEPLLDLSVNAKLLAAGHAYPAFYATLPATLRTHLAGVSRTARDNQPPRELWARSTADPNGAATITDLDAVEQLVIWPKLFRRLVPYFAAGFANFDGFDGWLRADPVDRDDELFLLDRLERGNLHDIVHAAGDTIQMTVWPEDFIISPDPVAPTPGPRPIATRGRTRATDRRPTRPRGCRRRRRNGDPAEHHRSGDRSRRLAADRRGRRPPGTQRRARGRRDRSHHPPASSPARQPR